MFLDGFDDDQFVFRDFEYLYGSILVCVKRIWLAEVVSQLFFFLKSIDFYDIDSCGWVGEERVVCYCSQGDENRGEIFDGSGRVYDVIFFIG